MKSTMRAVVSKPSGGDREEVVAESVGGGDGTVTETPVFREPKSEGGLLVAEYEPVRGARDDSLSRGRIAWNAATGEPAFLEAQLVNPPTGLKELHLRGDFAGAGDAIYTRLMKTNGVGGILWIKRKFEITVEMAPVPAP